MSNPPTVFISYRREDSQAWAGRIADFLRDQTDIRVLLDVDSIERGVDYTKAIAQQISESDIVLALVGKDWLDAIDARGERRLEDPDDPVRVELENALRQDKRVIPVIVDGSALPSRKMLPPSIGDLAVRNGITLTHESFRRDLRYLVEDLGGSEIGLGDGAVNASGANEHRTAARPKANPAVATRGVIPSTARRVAATLVDISPVLASILIEPSAKHGETPAGWVYVTGIVLTLMFIGACTRPHERSGETLGKQLLGLKAMGSDGDSTRLRLLGREGLKYLWGVPTGLVSLMVFPIVYLHRRTRRDAGVTWHDRVASARVEHLVRVAPPAAAAPEVPARFANQRELEQFARGLTRDQFIELVATLKSRGWTQAEIRDRVQPLRPGVPIE